MKEKKLTYREIHIHAMRGAKRILFLLITAYLFAGCSRGHDHTTIKDLDEAMIDMKIYQENLGDMIKSGRLNDAVWLLEGADSVLQVMSNTFREHRKLSEPFSYFYHEKLKEPLNGIRKAIRNSDTGAALQHYRLLVRRCNNCHTDHDIDKQVRF
ncbi:MAG: hypothetical protein JNK14_17845 [Chitinophagaceae bacterium]|nr:hypothetical protein [Chitinophagaceae bacterium]